LARSAEVDVAAAVARLGGRLDTWRRLLARFVDELAPQAGQLHELASTGQADDAARLAHTLKGVAATLGAGSIAHAAGEAERALRAAASEGPAAAGDPPSARLLQASAGLRDALDAAAPALRRLCDAVGGASAQTLANPDAVVDDAARAADEVAALGIELQRLAALLADADMEALSQVDRMRAGGAGRSARFEGLDDAVARLDFDAALGACRAWLQEIDA
jgi:HPt (histidine-containing phosphotransfer) domain-containing protein